MSLYKNVIVDCELTIKECLIKLENNGYNSLVVIKKKKFLGILTDGDIRRLSIREINPNQRIEKFINKKFIFLKKNHKKKIQEVERIMLLKSINILPVIDNQKKIVNIFFLKDLLSKKINNNYSVVIMAGGKGTRMKPFTEIFPKALFPFKQWTILEEIINFFELQFFKNFWITTGVKSNILKKYFLNKKKKIKLNFVTENKPLGTIGVVKKIKDISNDFILTNCDTYIDLDCNNFINYHLEKQNLITAVVAVDNLVIDYGIFEKNQKNGLNFIEKPKKEFLINTGFYIINKKALDFIPPNKYFDVTDLIKDLLNKRKRIGLFFVEKDKWKDFGSWTKLTQ